MNGTPDHLGQVLLFVAHPDDETIGCSGLLQRATASLVVFAVDGAPPHYGFERTFGSLRNYSDARFTEAALALKLIPQSSLRRLAKQDGTHYQDQHLFKTMPSAFNSLKKIVHEYSPDVIVTHAYEGGHIDHDACHVLATQVAKALGIRNLEFPSYWRSDEGQDIFQQFRGSRDDELILKLSEREIRVKQQMLAEYRSQQELTSVFRLDTERFRPVINKDSLACKWPDYPFENRRSRLKAEVFARKVKEFEECAVIPTRSESLWGRMQKRWGL